MLVERTAAWMVGLGLLFAAATASAEEGWSFSKLNPFGGDKTSDRADSGGGLKMPTLSWPTFGGKKAKSRGPSAWSKFNSGVKGAFSKTADALNPWDDDERPRVSATGRGRSYDGSPSFGKKESSGGWIPWLPKKERKPESVADFLKQPQVPY